MVQDALFINHGNIISKSARTIFKMREESLVGLSNILDSERKEGSGKFFSGREPGKRAHGQVVGAILVCSELHTKIGKREEAVRIVEPLLILAVAAFHLPVVAGRVGADQLVPDSKPRSGQFKPRRQVFFTVGEAVGKLKTIVCLHAFHLYAAAFEPGCHFLQEISGRIGALLRVSAQIAKARIFVDRRILVQTAPPGLPGI